MSDAFEVLIAGSVVEDLLAMSSQIRSRFFNAVDLLERFPEIGHVYVADLDEDELPFPCRGYHVPVERAAQSLKVLCPDLGIP